MSRLSVTDVQNALKLHAKSGHDIIGHNLDSGSTGVTFTDGKVISKNYPMTYGSLLTMDHSNLPEHLLTTLIPLGESGNIASITSLPYNFEKNRPRWVSRHVRNPHIHIEDSRHRSSYTFHKEDKPQSSSSSYENMHEYLKRVSKLPSRLTTHEASAYGFRPREIDFSNIKHHDIAEAAWGELTRSTWHQPDKPDEINIRNIGDVVLVNHHPTQSLSLYIPSSERLLLL